jgi:hypothetical protein
MHQVALDAVGFYEDWGARISILARSSSPTPDTLA